MSLTSQANPSLSPAETLTTPKLGATAPSLTHEGLAVSALAPKRVLMLGNPNVGKSVLFNAFSGRYVEVSNFPGTTVSVLRAELPAAEGQTATQLMDTPGVYGLCSLSDEERVTQSTLAELEPGDVILNVVSAQTLARDLFLTQQLLDWGLPLVLVVNQLDEAEAAGLQVDLPKLQTLTGVPVVGCIATQNQGIQAIQTAWLALSGAIQQKTFAPGYPTPGLPDAQATQTAEANPGERLKLYGLRRQHVNALVGACVQQKTQAPQQKAGGKRFSGWLGLQLLSPIWGGLSLLVALLALYQVIGVWVAGDLVDLLETKLMGVLVLPWLQKLVGLITPAGSALYTFLAGEFGVLTMTPQYLIGVIFPLVFGFNLYLSVLEDCGYLPRLAVLADGLLNRLGLNGRAIIPMILGLGCVTMATVSTRVLTTQRERTIANTLLAITIPCSAQLGVIMGMMALAGGLRGWLVYISFLSLLFVGLGSALNAILPGRSTPLVLDLPPMRWPKPAHILKKAWTRSVGFIIEAAPLFLLGSVLVAGAQVTGVLKMLENLLAPLTEAMLHLPAASASAFIMGMVRRDFGLAGFYQLQTQMSPEQIMTALVVITLFVPCIASATVMWKERGWKESAVVLGLSWAMAFGVGAVVCRLLALAPGLLG